MCFTQRFDRIFWCQVQSYQQALCTLHQCLLCLGQGNDDMLSPSQLQCSKRHRQTPEEDAAVSGAAAAPQQAAAMPPTLQLGKLIGQHMHTHCSGHYLPICALHCHIGSLLGRSIWNLWSVKWSCCKGDKYVHRVHQVNARGPTQSTG